jgi:hypothetical protein
MREGNFTVRNGSHEESPMLRKSTLLAVAASAALGLAMLAPTSASAMHGGGHGGGGHFSGGHGGGGHFGGGHFGGRFGYHHPRWHVRYYRPIWYGVRPVYAAYGPRLVSPGPCTCLSKEYTPEGAVLFKDRCTNEAAMNPPAQAPLQTGQLEPQQQPYQQQYVQPQPQPK